MAAYEQIVLTYGPLAVTMIVLLVFMLLRDTQASR
jgi:hypothetical protein